jgi:penicillin-binding protein 1A
MPGAQGGTYAAPVWHAFMLPASDGNCDDFPLPTEAFVSSPFFGEYSSTGSSYDDDYGNDYTTDPYTESPDSTDGGTESDPNLYESDPQPAPDVQVPPAQEELAPPAGGGTGAPDG